jgi:hypothetical protein
VRARRLTDQQGRRLLQIVRRGKHGPVRVRRAIVMGGSDHRNHPALARKLQACLRWRNARARHPGVLAAQRRERARLRSERRQRRGRPEPKAA